MQFNSFGDIFAQTYALLANQQDGLVPDHILIIPTFSKVNSQVFNEALYREIKFIIESNSCSKCIHLPRFLQSLALRVIALNFKYGSPFWLERKVITSSQLFLKKSRLLEIQAKISTSKISRDDFQIRLNTFGISPNYAFVAIRSQFSTKSKSVSFSEKARSSDWRDFIPAISFLATKYDHVIIFCEEGIAIDLLEQNVIHYNTHPVRNHLMDFMMPAFAKMLVGNLFGVTDARILNANSIYLAVDVPLPSLCWSMGIHSGLPKLALFRHSGQKATASELFDPKFFSRHGWTSLAEKDLEFRPSSSRAILEFVKNATDHPIKMGVFELDQFRKDNLQSNHNLNSIAFEASRKFENENLSGLNSGFDCRIFDNYN